MIIWRYSQIVDIVNPTTGINAPNDTDPLNGNNRIAPFQLGLIKEDASFAIN